MTHKQNSPKAPLRRTGPFALLAALLCIAGSGASAVLPASAGAYATIEGPPKYSAALGLPDGRAYEQVSPANKNGNEAGSGTGQNTLGALNHYGLASPDGNAVLFEGTGPIGASPWGASEWFVATKNENGAGWSTRAVLPRAQQSLVELEGLLGAKTLDYLDPSQDLQTTMVEAHSGTLAPQPNESCQSQLYLAGTNPFLPATWLARPVGEGTVENCAPFGGVPVGGTPNFSTVYFTYAGTLLPADSGRATHAGSGSDLGEAWGFYEDHEGELREAGVLPGGEVSPFGAVPAASGYGRNPSGNQISEDGERAFFVSPDPDAVGSCVTTEAGKGDSPAQAAAACAPELYVRENGERTLLVSADTLLPEAGGLPASAPGGVLQMPNPVIKQSNGPLYGSYVFASPDGSQAFFQSASALTGPAEEASPGSEPKTYDFDLDTGTLTYLPGVVGEIVATDKDGSSLAFVRPEEVGKPGERGQLELWSAGAGGGSVTQVTQLPGPPVTDVYLHPGSKAPIYVSEGRMSSDGSVLMFETATSLSSAFNGGGYEQIYRYDVPANTLGCVSCAPAGVTPNGSASFSALHTSEVIGERAEKISATVDERGMSSTGDRVFFETPVPLVAQDTNTNTFAECAEDEICQEGGDVYEWENGVVYLISTGKSSRDSYLLGSSESGSDVFFATAEGLVPGDTDGGYDVYDARIPHEGEPYPPAAVPCEGAVCQGPPNVPAPLTPPTSATFSGLGNPAPEVTPPPPVKATTKTVKCAKGKKLNHGKCVKKSKSKKAKKASHNGRTSR